MKRFFYLLFFVYLSQTLHAQKDIEVRVNKVIRYIERNFQISEKVADSNGIDFFVYDILIDSNGIIQNVHALILDSIRQKTQALNIAEAIKSKFVINKSMYSKVLIPVQINYTTDDEFISKRDINILETIRLFETLSKCDLNTVFISRVVSLNVFLNRKGAISSDMK